MRDFTTPILKNRHKRFPIQCNRQRLAQQPGTSLLSRIIRLTTDYRIQQIKPGIE